MRVFLKVAQGILDCDDYLQENLASAEAVQAYADSMDITLSDDAANKILEVCTAWVEGTGNGDLNGSHDYYYTVSKPLDDLESTTQGEVE